MKTNLADIKSSTINMLIGILVLLTLIKTMFSPPKGNNCLPFATSCVCIYSFSLSTEKKKNQALMLIANALALLKTMLVLQWASAKNNHNSSPVLTCPF